MQTKALVILNFLDDIDRHQGNQLALKRAFLGSGMADPTKLFPEEFNPEPQGLPETQDDDAVNFDYSDVTWKSGGDAYAEFERLTAQVEMAKNGHLSGDALAELPEWTEWR